MFGHFRIARLTFCGALLLIVAPAALAQPRGAFKGDDIGSYIPIALNASKTVDNIQLATLEAPLTEDASCDSNDSSDHSVWFGFDVPAGSSVNIEISSGGSVIYLGSAQENFITVSLYRVTAPASELGCTTTGNLAYSGMGEGSYRVRFATDYASPVLAPSRYRVTIRLRALSEMLQDGEFNTNPLGVVWKAKNAGTPPKVVRDCSLSCVVKFTGAAKAKLVQTVIPDPSFVRFKAGDLIRSNTLAGEAAVGGANIKLTILINYSDGTPPTRVSAVRTVTSTGLGVYVTTGQVFAEIASKAITNIKFTISSPTVADTFSVASASLAMLGSTSLRDSALLPLPPSP